MGLLVRLQEKRERRRTDERGGYGQKEEVCEREREGKKISKDLGFRNVKWIDAVE